MIKFTHNLNQKDRKVTAVGTKKCDSWEITKAVFSERPDKIKAICSVNRLLALILNEHQLKKNE